MSEIMDKADVLERYARAQAASDEPTLVRDTFRHLLERKDAAERERDALREAFARVYDGDATLVRDAFDGAANTPTKAAAYRVAGAVATARAALTANHSAPQEQQP